MNEEIKHAYDQLRYWGLTNSQSDFSRRWLGQCDSYYGSIKARGRTPCLPALVSLTARVQSHYNMCVHVQQLSPQPHQGQQCRSLEMLLERLNQCVNRMATLRVAERAAASEAM